ncbi:MFS transporter [bacterium]|nr:MFS transporter [bacterium]
MYTSQQQPLSPALTSRVIRRSPIYYGWIIAIAATLGMIMTSPGQTYAVSIFLEHFIVDLGISRSLVSTLYTLGTLVGSFALPLIGRQIDVRGPRMMTVLISLFFGIACIYMGYVANAVMLGLGFVAIRMMGQGALGLVSSYTINQWWVRRRGMMMGLSGLGMSLIGMGLFPSLIQWLIDDFGWRTAYPVLGISILALMLPVSYLFYRERPEAYGLKPDGMAKKASDAGVEDVPLLEEEWTLPEVLRTPAFWIITAGLASMSMLSTGLFFHAVSIFSDNGLSAAVAASAFVPVAVTTALVNLLGGVLVDRISARFLLATALVFQAVVLVMAHSLGSVSMALFYGVALGATSGLQRAVSTVIWANYFGRLHLGAISGVTTTILVAGSAFGPMPFGIARDLMGSYNFILNISAIIPLFLAIVALFLRRPQK